MAERSRTDGRRTDVRTHADAQGNRNIGESREDAPIRDAVRQAFIQGYLAAHRELEGRKTSERLALILPDIRAAAERAWAEPGWIESEVPE